MIESILSFLFKFIFYNKFTFYLEIYLFLIIILSHTCFLPFPKKTHLHHLINLYQEKLSNLEIHFISHYKHLSKYSLKYLKQIQLQSLNLISKNNHPIKPLHLKIHKKINKIKLNFSNYCLTINKKINQRMRSSIKIFKF